MSKKENPKKKINYHQTLRDVATSMVRLKQPERLLKMITRFIDRQFGLTHTSLLIFEEEKKRFIFVDSKGSSRVPINLIRIDMDHPLVLWFQRVKRVAGIQEDYLSRAMLNQWMPAASQEFIHQKTDLDVRRLVKAMDAFKIDLAIPGYFKNTLLGLLLLGKKKSGRRFTPSEISFFQILTQDCSMAVKTSQYHQSLEEQNIELACRIEEIEAFRKKERDTYYEVMRALAQEVDAKDAYTFGHVSQVEYLGFLTAREMKLDMSGNRKDILAAGLILHDIGKIGIPDHVLKKPGRLTEEEWGVMKTHAEKGARILDHLSAFKDVAEIVRCHHENFDGTGYPRGLIGDQIPIEARIVAVVDAFHAIVSSRCYQQGRTPEEAFKEIKRCAGTQFDPVVVDAFIRALKKEMKKRGVSCAIHKESAYLKVQEPSPTGGIG
ncbi:MAG: HD-GYP domain-containing protein [Candidatus Omnitrophica bacterium]|nr:HD-GYP domain-containing protein [Candidatus Omnitrophota bacterium]